MNTSTSTLATDTVSIEIGGVTIALHVQEERLRRLIEARYAGFLRTSECPHSQFDVDFYEPTEPSVEDELEVSMSQGEWLLKRGDFWARWIPETGQGWIHQTSSPYAIDSVLRIVHTLILARRRGFLVHSASVIRGGKAFLFAGVSGAGKTTICRLAPAEVDLLTDEISYVQHRGDQYFACGTPFAGELARSGENRSAPIGGLFLLEKGLTNAIKPVSTTEAVRRLLRNVLFFAGDAGLVKLIFQSACEFAALVPVHRLVFVPDQRVWDIIH
jgi:hypothetical protein